MNKHKLTTKLNLLGIATLLILFEVQVQAAVVFSTGASISIADLSANFNSITTNQDLSSYTENSLFVTVADIAYQEPRFEVFGAGTAPYGSGYHYGSGGNTSYVSIQTTEPFDFYEIEFLLGSGFFAGPTTFLPITLQWHAYRDSNIVGSDIVSGLARGTVVHFASSEGIDELRVAATDVGTSPGFGNNQAIALDNLIATLVPEPSSGLLLIIAAVLFKQRRQTRG